MKNAVSWDVTLCGSCKDSNFLRSLLWLLITANVPSSPILVTLMMKAIRSSKTTDLIGTGRHNTPEDGILQHS
jgi:hypothetical protein